MSWDNEIRLINRAWKGDGSGWKDLISSKLTPEMFFDADAAEVFSFAIEQNQKHGHYPSEVFIKQNFPNFPRVRITDSTSMLIDAFKEWRQAQVIKQTLTEAMELYAKGKHDEALGEMEKGVGKVAAESVSDAGDVDLTKDTLDRLKAYEEFAQRPKGLLGWPTGYPTIDDVLSGLQAGQLVTVVAEPKVGKSTLAMQMGINAHDAGARTLFQTIEMSSHEMTQRYECQRAGISYNRFRTGALKNSEKKRYKKMLVETGKMSDPFVVSEKVMNLPQINAKIEEYKPDLVIVDGIYLLDSHPDYPPGSPQALTYLSRSFKALAQHTDTCILITTQALHHKLQGGKLSAHSIGYCVDEETEILTEDGWRTHDQIREGDVVLTLNHGTGLSEWQPMSAVNRFPAMSRDLVLMEGKAHSSLSTAQHRWPVLHHYLRRGEVTREWRTTGELNSCDYVITAAERGDGPEAPTYSDAFVDLMAWFWTEGHINGDYGNVGISQSHARNPKYVQMIRESLTEMFGDPTPSPVPRDGGTHWREHRRDPKGLTEFWLNTVVGKLLLSAAPDKVPHREFLRSLTKEQLHRFIRVSMLADNNGPRALSQKSHAAAEMFQFALTLAGINSSLTEDEYGMWRVGFRSRQVVTPVASARQGRRFKIETVRHDGMIWCPTTPNGTWLARRKGNVYFTGNSSSFFQDSDLVIGLEKNEEEDEDSREMSILASRHSGTASVTLDWSWDDSIFEEMGSDW